jgi:uncharacterized protein (TIGR00304 family)
MPDLVFIGIGIIFAGFLVVFLAMVMSGNNRSEREEGKAQIRGGGVIMIGPIPVIFGSDAKWTSIAIVLAIILIVIVLLSGIMIRQ